MPIPRPIKHKLYYSKILLDALDADVARYLDSPLDTLSCEKNDDGDLLVTVGRGGEVPSIIRLRCGDVLQNLRSTLDYLVTELVLANGGKPTNKHAFPICDSSAAAFNAAKKNRLKDVPETAIELIETFQPYLFGEGRKNESALYVLDELTNINKHRSILLARKRTVLTDQIAVINAAGETIGYDASLAPDDEKVSRLITEAIKMKVNKQIAIFVQFDEGPAKGQPVISVLGGLLGQITNRVLKQFERFFV